MKKERILNTCSSFNEEREEVLVEAEGEERGAQVVFIPGPPSSPRSSGYYDYRAVSNDKVRCSKRGRSTRVYTLERIEGSWSCNCMGYAVRRGCKHVKYCPFRALPSKRKESQ